MSVIAFKKVNLKLNKEHVLTFSLFCLEFRADIQKLRTFGDNAGNGGSPLGGAKLLRSFWGDQNSSKFKGKVNVLKVTRLGGTGNMVVEEVGSVGGGHEKGKERSAEHFCLGLVKLKHKRGFSKNMTGM